MNNIQYHQLDRNCWVMWQSMDQVDSPLRECAYHTLAIILSFSLSLSFFSPNINELCIWRTWRVCIQVELVTGGLSPVCASCFTTSLFSSFLFSFTTTTASHRVLRSSLSAPSGLCFNNLVWRRDRGTFARASQLWRRSAYHRNIISTNFKFPYRTLPFSPLFIHVYSLSVLLLYFILLSLFLMIDMSSKKKNDVIMTDSFSNDYFTDHELILLIFIERLIIITVVVRSENFQFSE